MLIVDQDGQILDYNSQFVNLWGLEESDIDALTVGELFEKFQGTVKQPSDFVSNVKELSRDRDAEKLTTLELTDGRIFEQYTCPVHDEGEYTARLWNYNDITERERARKRARKMAFQDPLTDLPNRIKFLEYLQGMLLYNESNQDQAAVICLDLNRFKRINNSIGQDAGDEVLKESVERWRSVMDDDLLMARTGGDEFMIFVPEYRDRDQLESILDDLIEALDDPFEINNLKVDVRVNAGVALFPRDSEAVDDLLSMAHSAMAEARRKGFNNYEFFLSGMQENPTDIVSLEADLREAIKNEDLAVHFQPQVSLDDQEVIGFEALLRWEHPERGMIDPAVSIPLAEETGLILPVGEWVLNESCERLVEWQKTVDHPLQMSVNVSAEQIVQQTRLLDSVRDVIDETGVDPGCLELEITEHVALRDLDFTSDLLHEFHEMSIRTSVDDFGTGHSTMTYLQELPYDRMKIDRSFIDGLAEYKQNHVMVDAMISLANELGLDVVAEGVETAEQLRVLRELDCDIIQGFYCAKPMPADDIKDFLKQEDPLEKN